MSPGATLLLLFAGGAPSALAADLLEAAIAYLGASPAVAAALPGGVWGDEAPAGAALPFAVLSEPEGDSDNESLGASIETATLQLSVFAADKAAARAIRRTLAALLSDAPLTFAAGALLHLRADGRTGMKDPDRGPGGRDVWQEVQLFEAVVGH